MYSRANLVAIHVTLVGLWPCLEIFSITAAISSLDLFMGYYRHLLEIYAGRTACFWKVLAFDLTNTEVIGPNVSKIISIPMCQSSQRYS